ncbi:PREDICTED: gephyrin [Dinoponera quadriceps]|uniref:Gephyrin n=1 Tax=Dinoponera quadriceps TaxID=609295 RepID=A0A6P3Y558_DINQU|nr:PREDICTED: gephyrin [Dinoponera quadriceps]
MAEITFAILTVSDTCAKGEKVDTSGPALKELISDTSTKVGNILKGNVICTAIVPDDKDTIMKYLISRSDKYKANVILTTGGTGFSKRDVTPEATKKVINKEAPGMFTAMLIAGLEKTSMAMLSRAVCGIRNKTLIINLPGSRNAVEECLTALAPVIPHAVDLITDRKALIAETHKVMEHTESSLLSQHAGPSTVTLYKNVAQRHRQSPFPMISVEEAMELIRKNVPKAETEVVNTKDAYGRILAKDVYSFYDLPPFRASIKDGYAVLASDGKGRRKVLCGVTAGSEPFSTLLKAGTCVRVNTGAPVPEGATAVVQVEDTNLISENSDKTEEEEIEIMTEPAVGQDIRPIGCDIEKESLVLNAYTNIGPTEIGLLAACGVKEVTVTKLPSIGVLSTGNELQEIGQRLEPACVYDSNRITLITLLKENDFTALDFGISVDEEMVLISKMQHALQKVDVLVTTGSVSMGDRDLLKPILQEYFKATIHFGRVNMKPGKPTTFATCTFNNRRKYILCLPGNPVSAVVTARLFLLTLLNEMIDNLWKPIIVKAKLTSSYKLDPRPEYARAILEWNNEDLPLAYSTGNQISSKLLSCKGANALLMLPGRTEKKRKLNEGEIVPAMLIGFT